MGEARLRLRLPPDYSTALVALLAFGLVAIPLSSCDAAEAQARPLVLVVHGRDQGKRIESEIREEWLKATLLGLNRAGFKQADQFADFAFVWYGDIYADDGVDRTCSYVQAVPPAELDSIQKVSAAIRRWMIARVGAVPGLQRDVADLLIHDTRQYLAQANFRCATDLRLKKPLDGARDGKRPVILVAHSMGSLVSFSVLRHYDTEPARPTVVQFITMGSQLGLKETLMALEGSFAAPPVKVPISIERWTNVVAKGDLLALPQATFFEASNKTRQPADVQVDNGIQSPHSGPLYLRQAKTGSLIGRAICEAIPAATRPPVCSRLLRH